MAHNRLNKYLLDGFNFQVVESKDIYQIHIIHNYTKFRYMWLGVSVDDCLHLRVLMAQ